MAGGPNERLPTDHDKIGVLYSPHASAFGKVVFDYRCRLCWHTAGVADTEAKYSGLVGVAEMAVKTWPKEGTLAIWVTPMREALAKLEVKP